ncbi:unnamed protein product [Strongylus vulgaris]|uniref:Uncharacterized protein n=1 Tax=Strongylus vulgaris TaxID=40348 RepID=A0A3P7J5L5_STRVU|nr:unnamed protein product [Strongylus vulgaris]
MSDEVAGLKGAVLDAEKFKTTAKRIQELIDEINAAMLPYWRKDAIREQCKTAQKTLDSYKKQADAAVAEKSLVENGLKASQWVNEVCGVLGGRGGGKDANAQNRRMSVANLGIYANGNAEYADVVQRSFFVVFFPQVSLDSKDEVKFLKHQ